MAPVTFCRNDGAAVQPYHITPWQNEKIVGLPPVLVPTRGDFFCLPFGGNGSPYRGERHPAHGETCGARWSLEGCEREGDRTTLAIRLETKVRSGIVRRMFTLVDGQDVVYCRSIVEGYKGPAPFAHHAILRTSGEERTLLISTSKFFVGRTYPVPSADPVAGEYQSLASDVPFRSLQRVPSIFKNQPPSDCSAFPVRRGFGDLLQQFEKPAAGRIAPSWVAAVNIAEGWMWFALKDPAMMPGRLFWIENHGRHGVPWNGRNSCLGIEDGCMYFDRGIVESSRANPINRTGVATSMQFPGNRPVDIRYIQGAVRVPRRFGRVENVEFRPGAAIFHSESGKKVCVPVKYDFLYGGEL